MEGNGIPRHVKHIRPRNDTRSLCIVPDIEIEVGTDTCHGNTENHEEQIEDVLERQEKDIKAERVELKKSMCHRDGVLGNVACLPNISIAIWLIRKDQGGVLFRCGKF